MGRIYKNKMTLMTSGKSFLDYQSDTTKCLFVFIGFIGISISPSIVLSCAESKELEPSS